MTSKLRRKWMLAASLTEAALQSIVRGIKKENLQICTPIP